MASPFRYFRKHTKAFMAVAAVMCMFLFVFASGTGSSGRGGADDRDASAPVATWNGGSLNEGELSQLVYQRRITDQFLRMLFMEGGGQSAYDFPTGVPMLLLQSDRPEAVEEATISTEVLASLAADAGITVSDATINHFLLEFGLKRVGTPEIRGILANLGRQADVRTNETIVFNTLRKMLMAYFYSRPYGESGGVVLPSELWDDWRSVNERISLQAAAFPVEKFLDKVPKPTDEQLKTLYDQYKEAEPNAYFAVGGRELPSPNPGFAEPRRVKVQYLAGSVAERTKKFLDTVTEEEIATYYEGNKRTDFVKDSFGDFGADDFGNDPTTESADSPAESGAETPATGTDAEAAPGAEASTDSATNPPAEDAAPADEGATSPADAADPAVSPAEPVSKLKIADPPAAADEATDAAPANEEAAPTANEGEQSLNGARRSPFRLAALQAAPDDNSTDNEDAAVPSADATVESAATPPVDAPTADAATAGEPAAGIAAEPAADAAAPAIDPAAPAAAAEPPVEYEPLDKVRDEIREHLARDKAVQQLQQAIGEAAAKLQTEYNQYGRLVAEAAELERTPPQVPAKLASLDWLAEEYGLEVVKPEALTYRQLFETPLGKAFDEQSGRIDAASAAFYTLEPYEPFVAKEDEGDWYLVTKVEDTPKRVPPFEEVRDQVAAAWTHIEAAKLAEQTAQDLAKEAEASTEPFDQFFAAKGFDVVKQTELFSRRSYPVGPGLGSPPELSDVPELTNVGPEIIAAAFKLEDGKAAAVLNFDHSVAYVVRLNSRQYTQDELRKDFLREIQSWAGYRDMVGERQRYYDQALNDRIFQDVAGLEFDADWQARRAERIAQNQ